MTLSEKVPKEDLADPVEGGEVPYNYYPPVRQRKRFRLRPFTKSPRSHGKFVVWLCFAWLILMVVGAVAAQWLPIRPPNSIVGSPDLNPSWTREFLGTDAIGRSMLSRLVFGARVSLGVSALVVLVSMVVGGTVGLISAYYRGAATVLSDWLANTILSIPGLLLLLTILVMFRISVPVMVGAISVIFFPGFMRVTRATATRYMASDFITSATGLGATARRIITRELMPNTAVALVTFAAVALPGAMITEGALSYLGFGLPPPTASWGEMIAQGQQELSVSPWQTIIPCLLFVMTVFAFYTAGDWLRAKVDVQGMDE